MRFGSLVLAVTALAATLVFAQGFRDALQALHSPSAYALPRILDSAGRTYQNGNTNDNDDGDNEDDDNEDDDNEDSDNENGDNEDFDNEDDFDIDFGISPDPTPPTSTIRQPEPVCSTPGRDTVFTSFDDKLRVTVPASIPSPVRVDLFLVINAHEAPSPPGTFVYPLVYEIQASSCDAAPLATFPAEVNLAIRYTDAEVIGLDESRFVIGRLDMTTGAWVPMDQRANDPAANVVAATISEPGFYMVWEAR